MPDIGADRLDGADGIAAGDEVLRRAIGLEGPLHIGLEIGHQRLRLDTNEDAAGAQLGDMRVDEAQRAPETVELPGLHDGLPASKYSTTRPSGWRAVRLR